MSSFADVNAIDGSVLEGDRGGNSGWDLRISEVSVISNSTPPAANDLHANILGALIHTQWQRVIIAANTLDVEVPLLTIVCSHKTLRRSLVLSKPAAGYQSTEKLDSRIIIGRKLGSVLGRRFCSGLEAFCRNCSAHCESNKSAGYKMHFGGRLNMVVLFGLRIKR